MDIIVVAVIVLAWTVSEKNSGSPPNPPVRVERPNIVLITIDTLRRDHLGCYGSSTVSTPNLDSIAAEGTLFENYFSTANNTLPAHFSILSGIDSARYGIFDNGRYDLRSRLTILPSILKRHAYRTYGVAAVALFHPGFLIGFGEQFDTFYSPQWGEWKGDQITKQFGNMLPRIAQQQFFLWLHYYDPHTPYEPPLKYREMYQVEAEGGISLPEHTKNDPDSYWITSRNIRTTWTAGALYRGEVSFTDEQIGQVRKLLQNYSLDRKTILMIVADHGENLGERGQYYRHHGIYNTTTQVPFIVCKPGDKPGKVTSFVSAVDIAPTILELADVQVPKSMDGISLVPSMEDKVAKPNRVLYAHQAHDAGLAVFSAPYKLIYHKEDQRGFELFNIIRDPFEKRTLFHSTNPIAAELKKTANAWKPQIRNDEVKIPLEAEHRETLKSLGYAQ